MYIGEEICLEEYHRRYFEIEENLIVSWNKHLQLVILAQDIVPSIRQSSLFLRKKGLDVRCLEFKYFSDDSRNKLVACDMVVGEEEFASRKASSAIQLPKTDRTSFTNALDSYGKEVFQKLFEFADQNKLMFRWGSKGFSLNLPFGNRFVPICFGYPPTSALKQSIYTGFGEIRTKVKDSDIVISEYRSRLGALNTFVATQSNIKWVIDKEYSQGEIDKFIAVLDQMTELIRLKGLDD